MEKEFKKLLWVILGTISLVLLLDKYTITIFKEISFWKGTLFIAPMAFWLTWTANKLFK